MTQRLPTLITPRPPHGLRHFVSGASAISDLRGLVRFLIPTGVSIQELSPPVLEELLSLAHLPWSVFVDTGAFSEVEAGADGKLVVVRPIEEAAWHARLKVALRIAEAFGARAHLVAPDRVGDQAETLIRLRQHRDEVLALRAAGANIVVPLQRGAMSTASFEREAAAALGFDDFIRAIPGNKDAMPPEELESFLTASRPAALHLLGVGPRSQRLPDLLAVCRRLIPAATLTCDSNGFAALVGRTNGRGGGPRPLTAAQAWFAADGSSKAREDAVAWTFGVSAFLWRFQAVLEEAGIAGVLAELDPAVPPTPPGPVQLDLFDSLPERAA